MNIRLDLSKVRTLDRLEELVLYVINLCEKDSQFAYTKLNKLVFRVDLEAFCRTGRTVSGATYQKEKFGPVPRAMPIILKKLESGRRIAVEDVKINAKPAKRPTAQDEPDLSEFSPRDLEIISKVIAENFNKSGTRMSNETHNRLAYDAFEMGETIPFSAWLVEPGEVTEEDRKIAARLEVKAGARHGRS